VGIYLAEFCLIGLFAIGSSGSGSSVGPLVLMIIFAVGTVIWHMQLRSAMSRHLTSLPSDLLAEEHCSNNDEEKGYPAGQSHTDARKVDSGTSSGDEYQVPASANPPAPPTGFMGKIKGFLLPNRHASAAAISKYILSPHLANPVRPYTQQEREAAYLHPALSAETPIIWLARDEYGLSQQEVQGCRRAVGEGLEVSDEDAWVDEKGNVNWNERELRKAPIFEEDVRY